MTDRNGQPVKRHGTPTYIDRIPTDAFDHTLGQWVCWEDDHSSYPVRLFPDFLSAHNWWRSELPTVAHNLYLGFWPYGASFHDCEMFGHYDPKYSYIPHTYPQTVPSDSR